MTDTAAKDQTGDALVMARARHFMLLFGPKYVILCCSKNAKYVVFMLTKKQFKGVFAIIYIIPTNS